MGEYIGLLIGVDIAVAIGILAGVAMGVLAGASSGEFMGICCVIFPILGLVLPCKDSAFWRGSKGRGGKCGGELSLHLAPMMLCAKRYTLVPVVLGHMSCGFSSN